MLSLRRLHKKKDQSRAQPPPPHHTKIMMKRSFTTVALACALVCVAGQNQAARSTDPKVKAEGGNLKLEVCDSCAVSTDNGKSTCRLDNLCDVVKETGESGEKVNKTLTAKVVCVTSSFLIGFAMP